MDNNSKDDSLEVVQYFNDRTKIKIHNVTNYRPGQSINQCKFMHNEYVLVLSAHTQITNLDFDIVKKELESHLAIFGKQVLFLEEKNNSRYIWSNFDDKETNKFSSIENRLFPHNAFCFYKRETLKVSMPNICI